MNASKRMREMWADERGFGIVEVVVSAAVMFMVTAGTLSLIDGSQRTTVKNRARTVAADLAEQDQERLRSTRVLDLSNYASTRSVTVGGVPYTVVSKSDWLKDQTGAPVTCTNGSGQAEYMRITSTVTDGSGNAAVKPVTVSSLVAPEVGTFGPQQGTLAVEIRNRSNVGLTGIPVTITGPQTGTVSTDANGCAVFNYYKVGAYQVNFNVAGYVNPLGNTDITISGQINAGTVNTTAQQIYDRPASIAITAQTRKSNGATPVATTIKVPIRPNQSTVTVANSGIANGKGYFNYTGTADATGLQLTPAGVTTGKVLFPFLSGDTVYAGNCTTMDPSAAGGGGSYYTTNPGLVPLDPDAATAVTIFQPWLKVRVRRAGSSTSDVPNASVFAKEACGTVYKLPVTTDPGGRLAESLPWGIYTLCATDGTIEKRTTTNVALNKNTDAIDAGDLILPSSGGSGNCSTL